VGEGESQRRGQARSERRANGEEGWKRRREVVVRVIVLRVRGERRRGRRRENWGSILMGCGVKLVWTVDLGYGRSEWRVEIDYVREGRTVGAGYVEQGGNEGV
jgi:hypothetical protein